LPGATLRFCPWDFAISGPLQAAFTPVLCTQIYLYSVAIHASQRTPTLSLSVVCPG